MKASKASIQRAVDAPGAAVRFYLFHGPDEAQSRALGARVIRALDAAKFSIPGAAVKSDPALLADEAAAMGLFGGRRAVWIEPAGDEIVAGVEALLEAPSVEAPVIAIAGQLRKASALLKLGESHSGVLAYASYMPEGQDAELMVVQLGRREGLAVPPDVAARIADSAGNDQGIVAQELAKLALYVDASPEAPKELGHDALDAVGIDMAEGDLLHLADLALAGDSALASGLERLPHGGNEAVPVIRALQRRLLMLAPARARMDSGESLDGVMASLRKVLFWKDKSLVERILRRWQSKAIATAVERSGALERQVMSGDSPPSTEALGEELIAIARSGRRR